MTVKQQREVDYLRILVPKDFLWLCERSSDGSIRNLCQGCGVESLAGQEEYAVIK
jgi:hypothetical protein